MTGVASVAAPPGGSRTNAILTINAGSSSLKFALFAVDATLRRLSHGQIEAIDSAPHLTIKAADGSVQNERRWPKATHYEALLGALLDWVEAHLGAARLIAAGHRVVHGGALFTAPVIVTPPILQQLATLSPLAPLHQPHNLAAIAQVTALRPRLPQIACFDTAFHHSMPMVAHAIALPASLTSQGVRRYGFHGLSYEFIAGRLRQLAPDLSAGRIIAAHLGSGASMCAMANGVSVDSSMGFTALDGLMMATRCGSLDPGVVLYLQQQLAWTPSAIEDLLYRRAGLLGVSGESGDMRRLLDSSSPTAAAAVQLFVYRALREIGSLSAALQGLDGLVFTAGIGENSPRIRQQICAGLGWLGVRLDQAANAAGAGRISSADSAIAVWVIPTDEQKMIARHCRELVPV